MRFAPATVGSITIDASMRVGNLMTAWSQDLIHASYKPGCHSNIPKSVQGVYGRNLQRRIAEAQRDGVVIFDGPSYALCDYRIFVDNPITKSTRLELLLGPTSYYNYLATNLSVPCGDLPDDVLKILPSVEIPDLPLSNQFAINFSIVTSDNRLVLQRRSSRVANYPRRLANGVNGTTQRGVDQHAGDESEAGDPDPIATVRRECHEEIGILPARSSIISYGIAVDHRYYQPLLIGEVNIGVTFEEVHSAAMAWAEDKFEYSNFESLPLTPDRISESFVTDSWMPVCALTTLATLIHRVGRTEVQDAFERREKCVIE